MSNQNTVKQPQNQGPDLKALGLKSPAEVIDILSVLKIDGQPVITNDRDHLDPKQKAQTIMQYFQARFKIEPNDLPYLASMIKNDLKCGKLKWRRN